MIPSMTPATRSGRRAAGAALILALTAALMVSVRAWSPPYAPEVPEYRTKGPASAPVVVAVFSDMQCSACRLAAPKLEKIRERFGGKMRVMFVHCPFESHIWARATSIAAECAGRQGRFWELHDLLYARQGSWSKIRDADELRAALIEYSGELKLEKGPFSECLDDPSAAAAVDADVEEVSRRRVGSTPTFFINGRRFVGSRQLETHGINLIEDIVR